MLMKLTLPTEHGQAKLGDGDLVLGLSQFPLMPQLP